MLNDTWSIRKNVSLEGGLLKPEGNTVQAPPSGSGFYSRHGQHNSLKSFEELRSTPGFNSTGQAGTSKLLSYLFYVICTLILVVRKPGLNFIALLKDSGHYW